jgi:hypothetical protein
MVQAVIDFKEPQARILAIVKGKYGLKNKSEAANLIVEKFGETLLEPELRPEYREALLKTDKGKFKRYSGVEALKKELENA